MVLIVWEDAQSGTHRWTRDADLPDEFTPALVGTVGWLIREKGERITLAMGMSVDSEGVREFADLWTIPRGCIRQWTLLGNSWDRAVDKPAGQAT